VLAAGFLFGLFALVRWFLAGRARAVLHAYDGLNVRRERLTGDVAVEFDTYFGMLGGGYVWKHRVFLPSNEAETLLKRLHSFNLRWGWLSPGGLFVPFLSLWKYRSQQKAVRLQVATGLALQSI